MLLDTSGFLCLYEKKEPHHKSAVHLYDLATLRLTTNYILSEFTALAQVRGIPRGQIIEFSKRILDDAEIEVVWVDERVHRQAVELFNQRPDKTYSLCDAASFIIMRKYEVTEALTTDKHFEQEGFNRLLK